MKLPLAICAGLSVLVIGCTPQPAPPPTTPPAPTAQEASLKDRPTSRAINASVSGSDVVARVGTKAITKDELLAPMIQAHGLSFLLHLAQLELARQASMQRGVTVSAADITHERELTLQRMFKESDEAIRTKIKEAKEKNDSDAVQKLEAELNYDREGLLDQYLAQQYVQSRQYVSRAEFDIVLETNTHLRKIAEASPDLKKVLTEETLQKAFAAQYGEKAVVRHIQADNITGISEARRMLQAGQDFAAVAKSVSTNKNSGPLGGAVRPFTMTDTGIPQIFRDTAFALKVGEISETVQSDGAYHIIKLESRIAPKVVKFEDVKESLKAELYDRVLQGAVKSLRDGLSQQLLVNLKIENPELKALYDKRLQEGKVRQQNAIDQAMKRDRAVTAPPEREETPVSKPAEPSLSK